MNLSIYKMYWKNLCELEDVIFKLQQFKISYVKLQNFFLAKATEEEQSKRFETMQMWEAAFGMFNKTVELMVTTENMLQSSSETATLNLQNAMQNESHDLIENLVTEIEDVKVVNTRNNHDEQVINVNLHVYHEKMLLTITIMHVEDKDTFYFVKPDNVGHLKRLFEIDMLTYKEDPPMGVIFGVNCGDIITYRAVFVNNGDEKIIFCIDYGHKVKYSDAKFFFKLPGDFLTMPPQGIKCKLIGRKISDQIIDFNIDKFLEGKLFFSYKIEIDAVAKCELFVYIHDFMQTRKDTVIAAPKTSWRPIENFFKQSKSMEVAHTMSDSKYLDKNFLQLYITEIKTPVIFYAIKSWSNVITLKDEDIVSGQQLKYWPQVSQIMMARRNVDQLWYRAIIKGECGYKILIHYMDLGEDDEVPINRLCSCRKRFRKYPPAAKLYKIAGYTHNVTEFKELRAVVQFIRTAIKGRKMDVYIMGYGDTTEVEFKGSNAKHFKQILVESGYIVKENPLKRYLKS